MTLGMDEQGRIIPIVIDYPNGPDGQSFARALPYDLTGAFWNVLLNMVPPDREPHEVWAGQNRLEITIKTLVVAPSAAPAGEPRRLIIPDGIFRGPDPLS
jgi:hypothetical protein